MASAIINWLLGAAGVLGSAALFLFVLYIFVVSIIEMTKKIKKEVQKDGGTE